MFLTYFPGRSSKKTDSDGRREGSIQLIAGGVHLRSTSNGRQQTGGHIAGSAERVLLSES
jgi:hypothetical protein